MVDKNYKSLGQHPRDLVALSFESGIHFFLQRVFEKQKKLVRHFRLSDRCKTGSASKRTSGTSTRSLLLAPANQTLELAAPTISIPTCLTNQFILIGSR